MQVSIANRLSMQVSITNRLSMSMLRVARLAIRSLGRLLVIAKLLVVAIPRSLSRSYCTLRGLMDLKRQKLKFHHPQEHALSLINTKQKTKRPINHYDKFESSPVGFAANSN
jgi:hypothetical protein